MAEITVTHTSKVRKSRVFVSRGGEHFDRLKQISKHTKKKTLCLRWTMAHIGTSTTDERQLSVSQNDEACGIDDYKERNVTLYSLRHYGITQRITNGVTNLSQFAVDCGTSVEHITKTYYHTQIETSEQNALVMKAAESEEVDKN